MLYNVDYLCKEIDALKVLAGNILETVISVTIKDNCSCNMRMCSDDSKC